MAIFIEAGHNVNDPGAVSGKIVERDLTIDFKKDLKYFFDRKKKQYPKMKVYYDNDSWSLGKTISEFSSIIKHKDVLVSIHFNSSTNPKSTGSECFVSDKASQESLNLADKLTKTNSLVLGVKNRGVKNESQSNRGRLGILNMKGVAVLSEPVFINNSEDVANYFKDNGAMKCWLAEDYVAHIVELDKKLNPQDYV